MATIKTRLARAEQRAGKGKKHFPPLLLVTDRVKQADEVAEYERKYHGNGLVLFINKPEEI